MAKGYWPRIRVFITINTKTKPSRLISRLVNNLYFVECLEANSVIGIELELSVRFVSVAGVDAWLCCDNPCNKSLITLIVGPDEHVRSRW